MPASSDASCAAFAQCLKPYTGPEGRHFTVDYFKYLEAAGTVRPVTVFVHAVWGRLKLCTTGLPSSLRQVIKRLAPPFVTEDGFLTCSLDPIVMETPSTADKEVAKLKVPALLAYYKARAGGSTHVTAMSKVYELDRGA